MTLVEMTVVQQVHRWALEHLDVTGPTAAPAQYRPVLYREVQQRAPLLAPPQIDDAVAQVLDRMQGLGPLEPLLADPEVSEVMVNGPGPVWVDRSGALQKTDCVLEVSAIEHLVERIVGPLGRRVDRSSPFVDARLPDGSRVHVAVPPLAVDGPYITIRRFSAPRVDLASVASPGTAALLAWAVKRRMNILVSGGTSAGKTTLLNSLAAHIPSAERLVTVEDAAELQLHAQHVVRLETRPAMPDGPAAVSIRELVRNALRMRPDRIVVGEVRGPEALDMLQAMNTGHEGSLSTCHANGPADALRRLETMVLTGAVQLPLAAIRDQIHAALDLVVHVRRVPSGQRRVVAVCEPPPVGDTPAPELRVLANEGGLLRLPSRPPRVDGLEARQDWVEQ